MYTATIVATLVFLVFLIVFIYNAVKDNEGLRSFFVAMAIFVFLIGMICVGGIYSMESHEIEYPYTKTYTIKVHYLDGGCEVVKFKCEGWQKPYMRRYNASYSLVVGDYEVRNVTRYYVLEMERLFEK